MPYTTKEELIAKANELLEAAAKLPDSKPEPEPEFKYPMFFKSKRDGVLVRFEGIDSGVVVAVDKKSAMYQINKPSSGWYPHTDTSVWEQIPHIEHNGEYFYDKQPVWAWDGELSEGVLTFIDAKNECAHPLGGADSHYLYYRADISEVIKELQSELED